MVQASEPTDSSARSVTSSHRRTGGDEIGLFTLLRPLKEPLLRKWPLLIGTILAGWGKFMLPMAVPLITAYIIDTTLTRGASPESTRELQVCLAIAAALILGNAIAVYYRTALAQRLSAHLQYRLRKHLFFHIQRLSMPFFHRHHAGSLGSRVSSDITHAGIVIDKGLVQLSMDGVSFLVVAAVMLSINPMLAGIVLAITGIKGLVVLRFGPRIRRQRKSIQESQSNVTGRAAEIFSAITVIKAFAGERMSGQVFTKSSQNVRELQYENSHLQGSFQGLSHALLLSTQICVVFIGTWLVLYHPAALSKGELVGFLLFVTMINGMVQRILDGMVQIQDGFAALERIHDILTVLPDPEDAPDAVQPPLTGTIRFDHVRFGYRADEPVIDDLSFTFEAGKSYALVGPSGSGKSTLTQLMLRFYDPDGGTVSVDGHALPQIDQHHYRGQVAAVLQDPIIFSTSVRDNIAFATEGASDAEVIAAADKAQADEFIRRLPEGYDSPLGERGVALSGGQRQRLAIARALMRDPRVLILDEATSALDTVTERSIQDVIDGLQGSRTVVVIAHRLSTIRNVDEILVLDAGRIVEHGSYDELMRRNGTFARLAEEQTGEHAA